MYTSIKQIRQEFGIESEDLEIIRKELIIIQKNNHPDNNQSNYTDDNKNLYIKVDEAVQYIDRIKQDKSLIVLDKMTDLIKIVTEIVPQNKNEILNSNLDQNINTSLSNLHNKYAFPKISLSIITVIITFLFLFPNQVKENPMLDKYIDLTSSLFFTIWLSSILFLALFWLFVFNSEEAAKRKLSLLKMESTQNHIFQSFIYKGNKFTKDDLTNFIYYEYYEVKYSFNSLIEISKQIFKKIIKNEVLTGEIAQTISELIISKALKNNVISKIEIQSLYEVYEIKKQNIS